MMGEKAEDFVKALVLGTKARIAIAGVPSAGKTSEAKTISEGCGIELQQTDTLIHRDWSAASLEVAGWFNLAGPWIVEGVTVPRAIRKWFKHQAEDPMQWSVYQTPCDVLLWLGEPHEILEGRRLAMAKTCNSVLTEITPRLTELGVQVLLLS